MLKDFSPLLDEECFVGFQQEEEETDWVANGILGARRGHPFLRACMRLTADAFAETGVFLRSPAVTTAVLKSWGLREYGLQKVGGVRVCPAEYFYPFPWYEKFSPGCVRESTYCVHHWEASWLKSGHYKTRIPYRLIGRLARSRLGRYLADMKARA